MAISATTEPTIYRNLYEYTGHVFLSAGEWYEIGLYYYNHGVIIEIYT